MTYVVTEPCIGTKDRSCVEVCPVDCFYNHPDGGLNSKAGKEPASAGDVGMLLIHPDQCIHCGACEPECPVEAIFDEDDVPEKWNDYTALNAEICEKLGPDQLDAARVTAKK